MISKPIVPPWDDSAKNIVAAQIRHSATYRYCILTDGSSQAQLQNAVAAPIYSNRGRYSPGFFENLRVMGYGMRSRGVSLYHYFFAPNLVSSLAGRVQKTVARVKTVQTICSAPASYEGIRSLIFTDRVIVLSAHTKRALVNAGIDRDRIRYIKPGIEPLTPLAKIERNDLRRAYDLPIQAPVVVFPGDYEFSQAANTVARAVPLLHKALPEIIVVFACRIKRAPSLRIRDAIKRDLKAVGRVGSVRFLEDIPDMPAFIGAADLVLMPAESLYAKMDVPLVLLEALSRGVPVVLSATPPLDELLETGAGVGVPPCDPQALADAVISLIKNRPLREKMGHTGTRAVNTHYCAATMAAAVESVYDEVLNK